MNRRIEETTLLPDAALRKRFRRRLATWYGRPARDLPWRRTRDPYRIWLSEAMLQWGELAEGTTNQYTVSDLMDRYLIEVAPKKAHKFTTFDMAASR